MAGRFGGRIESQSERTRDALRLAGVLSLLFALTGTMGCTHVTGLMRGIAPESMVAPRLLVCEEISATEIGGSELRQQLVTDVKRDGRLNASDCARAMSVTYGRRAGSIADERTMLYDLPLVGLGVASAAVLAIDGSPIQPVLALGVAGGALGALRILSNVSKQPGLYGLGVRRAQCVEREARFLDSQSRGQEIESLGADRRTLVGRISSARERIDDPNGKERLRLQTAVAAGEAAVVLADKALTALARYDEDGRAVLAEIDAKLQQEIIEGRPDSRAAVAYFRTEMEETRTTLKNHVAARSAGLDDGRADELSGLVLDPDLELARELGSLASGVANVATPIAEAATRLAACPAAI